MLTIYIARHATVLLYSHHSQPYFNKVEVIFGLVLKNIVYVDFMLQAFEM